MNFRAARTVLVVLASVLTLVALRDRWLAQIGEFLIVADPVQPANAVVPLAGELSRVSDAAELLKRKQAHWFVITDMWVGDPNPTRRYAESVKEMAIERGVPPDQILIAPGVAATTYQEAVNLRQFAQDRHWSSIIVVTSPYHTRRARLILGHVFRDTPVVVAVRPVYDHWYRPEGWWLDEEGREVTLEEYLKLVLFLVGYHELPVSHTPHETVDVRWRILDEIQAGSVQ